MTLHFCQLLVRNQTIFLRTITVGIRQLDKLSLALRLVNFLAVRIFFLITKERPKNNHLTTQFPKLGSKMKREQYLPNKFININFNIISKCLFVLI